MGKIHVDHRLIWRNAQDRIVREETFASFALGKPEFDKAAENVEPGMLLTFQHGARIIFRAQG
tara:strand:+ start:5841 stop:6029 length:189 start_codon:yes stop_codon:yes gene_type:complete